MQVRLIRSAGAVAAEVVRGEWVLEALAAPVVREGMEAPVAGEVVGVTTQVPAPEALVGMVM